MSNLFLPAGHHAPAKLTAHLLSTAILGVRDNYRCLQRGIAHVKDLERITRAANFVAVRVV